MNALYLDTVGEALRIGGKKVLRCLSFPYQLPGIGCEVPEYWL